MLRNPGPTFGGSTRMPFLASSGPTAEIPMPTGAAAPSRAAAAATARSLSMQVVTTAAGPSAPGVRASSRAMTWPSGVTAATRIRLAPRSSARTMPLVTRRPAACGSCRMPVGGAVVTARMLRGADAARTRRGPRRSPGGGLNVIRAAGSAADLEDLATALGAGALKRRFAVLHRDPLSVLDFDLLLVLDAIRLGHLGLPPR